VAAGRTWTPAAARRWRALAVPAALAVTVLTLTLAAAPARAGRVVAARPGQPGPSVQSLEWWFSAWDIRSRVWPLARGAGVTVGVVDTGVQANLPDLRGAVLPGGDTTGARSNGTIDEDGHGTGMAALIAGQGVAGGVLGIAPEAKILPVRVGGDRQMGTASAASVGAGIRYAVDHGARVINLSLAGVAPSASSCDPAEQDAVTYALRHNVVVVAGAGNGNNAGNPPQEPASCSGVLAVGAVQPSLKLWPDSEQQPYVAVSAPGSDIVSLTADGGNSFGEGTSTSSAFVSGEAALVRSRYPSMPWYRVVQRIINTALPKGSPVPNDGYGYGIVRISSAVNASRYKVPADDPNPVYAAAQGILASPPPAQAASPAPARRSPAAAPASSGGTAGLAAVIAAVVVVAAGGTALGVVVARRRRRQA